MSGRVVVTLAFAVVTITALAQVASKPTDSSDKTKSPPGNCTVSGRVIGAADGAPLRSVRVVLMQANARQHGLVYGTTTDSDGRFELKQIESGRYEFFASHVGYLEQQYQAKGPGEGEGAVLSLASGQEVGDVLFRLVHAAVITGKVVDDAGEPMANVTITVLRKPSTEEMGDATPRAREQELNSVSVGVTDDRGDYRVFGLKPGEYYVKAAGSADAPTIFGPMSVGDDYMVLKELGSQYAPLFYPSVLQADQAQAVTVRAGEEAQADFAMRRIKVTEVAGRVIGADGAPAAHAYVALRVPNVNDWGGDLGVGTDAQGEFSIKGVPPGSYILSVNQEEHGRRRYTTQQKVEVGETKIDSIVIAIGRGAKLQGRIISSGGVGLDLSRQNQPRINVGG